MKTQEIVNNRQSNESLLINYFNKANVPMNRLQKVEVYNGRNCKCSAIQLVCNSEQEFNYHKMAFHYATQMGGDFFQYDARYYILIITIKDGWN